MLSFSISQHDTIDNFTLVYKQCKRQRKLNKTITLENSLLFFVIAKNCHIPLSISLLICSLKKLLTVIHQSKA